MSRLRQLKEFLTDLCFVILLLPWVALIVLVAVVTKETLIEKDVIEE